MPAIKAVNIKRGQAVLWEGQLWIVHENETVAKGNKRSYMSVKLKHFKNGNVVDFRLNVDEKVEVPFVDDKTLQ